MTRSTFLGIICLIVSAPALAQEPDVTSREELLAKMREQKAKALQPYKPKGIEKALLYVEEHRIVERLTIADGWYPRIGGLTTGGGFAAGVGYRKHLFDDRLFLNSSVALSTKAYKQVLGHASYPLWRDWLEIGTNFRWNDFPQEDFYGLGPDTVEERRVNFSLETTDIAGHVAVRPIPWLRFGAEIGHFSPTAGPGEDPRFPSLELIFDVVDVPGFIEQPTFLYKNLFIEVDYRDQPGNPRSGGLFRARYGAWDDRELERYDFGRFDGEAAYFFPIFDKKRVFAWRMGVSYVNNAPGNSVPFYFMPYIGGSDTVRGYKEFRFRDENVIFMNAEYRWEAFSGLDMALFFDMGEVADRWESIDLRNAKKSYGLGFRFNNYKSVFLRFDVSGGGEGTQIFFKFGPAF
jgi:Omp85 superfamily domain